MFSDDDDVRTKRGFASLDGNMGEFDAESQVEANEVTEIFEEWVGQIMEDQHISIASGNRPELCLIILYFLCQNMTRQEVYQHMANELSISAVKKYIQELKFSFMYYLRKKQGVI